MQLVAQLAGDPGAQHPHGHAAQRCGAAAVEAEVAQRLADGLLQDEQGLRPLDTEDERLGADVGNLGVPAALAELPRQPVAAPRGVAELLLAEPDEDALGGDPAVLIQLHVVPDLAGLEPGQVVSPAVARNSRACRPRSSTLLSDVQSPRYADRTCAWASCPSFRIHREHDLREPAVPALGVGLVLRRPPPG